MARYAQGGYIDKPEDRFMRAGCIHYSEYICRDGSGTVWHVQKHPDGDIRTPLNMEDDE